MALATPLVWHDIAGLVTSSAILSIILGLAMQETLGNLAALRL